MLSADTAATLRAGIHREIAYVYEHREDDAGAAQRPCTRDLRES